MSTVRRTSVVASVLVSLAACAAPVSEDISAEDETLYTTTVVTFAEDGTETVRTFTSTAAEMAAEVAAREAMLSGALPVDETLDEAGGDVGVVRAAISQTPSCPATSMWIYDTTDTTGNRLCFAGEGTVNLDNYTYDCIDPSQPVTCSPWSWYARSLWAGTSAGWVRSKWCNTTSRFCPSGATLFTGWDFYNAWQRVTPLAHAANPVNHDRLQLCAGADWCP